ncbi:hypothetical protein P43SY_011041 [Pythium insidiosum]|uniref:Purple acid phosphatase N-terminal domain-containing protein n=1 Tax=Pythium insidiosum TaxID=114742 RepID=A0AAD5LXS5_PYTIN|nr:hypothetical protein P43SY_011041 [Pythium insidiosum]
MCHAPATTRGPRLFRDPGVLFDAVMTGLQSGETYFYQVGSDDVDADADGNGDGVWSEVETFRMPPAAGEGPSTSTTGTTTGTATGTKTH